MALPGGRFAVYPYFNTEPVPSRWAWFACAVMSAAFTRKEMHPAVLDVSRGQLHALPVEVDTSTRALLAGEAASLTRLCAGFAPEARAT